MDRCLIQSYALIASHVCCRSNMKSVFVQGGVFAIAQASIFFIYSAGFYLGAFQVTRDPSSVLHATYDEIFR